MRTRFTVLTVVHFLNIIHISAEAGLTQDFHPTALMNPCELPHAARAKSLLRFIVCHDLIHPVLIDVLTHNRTSQLIVCHLLLL